MLCVPDGVHEQPALLVILYQHGNDHTRTVHTLFSRQDQALGILFVTDVRIRNRVVVFNVDESFEMRESFCQPLRRNVSVML